MSAKELQRQLGVTYKCAWRMGHEIRKHMSFVDGDANLDGDVEVDETYVGGKKKGKRGRGADGKTILFGMLDRDGDLMTTVVPNTKDLLNLFRLRQSCFVFLYFWYQEHVFFGAWGQVWNHPRRTEAVHKYR